MLTFCLVFQNQPSRQDVKARTLWYSRARSKPMRASAQDVRATQRSAGFVDAEAACKADLMVLSHQNRHTYSNKMSQKLDQQYYHRQHTTVKNAINMKSDAQAKLPYFEGIVKLQELPFLQMFISFAFQNLAVLCVKRISFFHKIFNVV